MSGTSLTMSALQIDCGALDVSLGEHLDLFRIAS